MQSTPFAIVVFRAGVTCLAPALSVFLLTGPALRAQRPLQDDDILQYLSQTITWYRDVSAAVQSATDSRETIFAEGLRQGSTETVRLAFDFARAQAAIPPANAAENVSTGSARTRNLAQAAAAAERRAREAQLRVEQLNAQIDNASGRLRTRLLALRDELTSELAFAKARADALRTLIGLSSDSDEGGLAATVAVLARSVPEAASSREKAPVQSAASVRTNGSQDFHPESSGVVGLTTELFSISRRMSQLDRLAGETGALRDACDKLRQRLRTGLREVIKRGDAIAQAPESTDVAALKAQRNEMDTLLARFKQLSASSTSLNQQSAQISASRGGVLEWRGSLGDRYNNTARYLLLRLGMLALELFVIWGFSKLWQRGTMRYVQDVRRRRQLLLLRRIVVGCFLALVIVLSFVTEFGSLATFAGFSAAGIAVAMQSVLLSGVAYFFLVGRWGVRVGDRVTVAGVTGEVADIGLFRLHLMELGGPGFAPQPTGRVVVFPNSVFFQPSAVFKQLPGIDYVWRAITVKMSETTDYSLVEERLLAAVESIYAEYRGVVEQQHRQVQSSLNLRAAVPRPEGHLRFVDSGLEITITYPVEIRRAAEIDDRIAREVIRQVENDPKLMTVIGAGVKIEATVG
jgi:small-conductance mechanosensitive channel